MQYISLLLPLPSVFLDRECAGESCGSAWPPDLQPWSWFGEGKDIASLPFICEIWVQCWAWGTLTLHFCSASIDKPVPGVLCLLMQSEAEYDSPLVSLCYSQSKRVLEEREKTTTQVLKCWGGAGGKMWKSCGR